MSDSNQNPTVTRRRVVKKGVAVTLAVGGFGTANVAADGNETASSSDSNVTTSDDSTINIGVITDVSDAKISEMTSPDSMMVANGTTDTVGHYIESRDGWGITNWKWINWTSWLYTGDELLWADSVGENSEANKLWSFVGHDYEDLDYRTNRDGVIVSALTTQVGEYDHPTDHAYPWVQVYVNALGENDIDESGADYWTDTL